MNLPDVYHSNRNSRLYYVVAYDHNPLRGVFVVGGDAPPRIIGPLDYRVTEIAYVSSCIVHGSAAVKVYQLPIGMTMNGRLQDIEQLPEVNMAEWE